MAQGNFTEPPGNKSLSEQSTTAFEYVVENIAGSLYKYYTPLIIIFGLIGNTLSSCVFCTSRLRLHSTRIYLSTLALSDSLFLFTLLPPWLYAEEITNIYHWQLVCQMCVYINYVSSCLSAWLVVAFTVERFVAVVYPLRRKSMCTMARAKCIVTVLVLFAILINSPVLILASPSVNDCNINSEYMVHASWFNFADTMVSFTCPLGIIFLLNVLIMNGVYRVNRARRVLQEQQAIEPESRIPRGFLWYRTWSPPVPPPPRTQHRVTRMLLIVSSVFVGLNVPNYTMRILAYAYNMSTDEYTGQWAAMQQISLMFFNTNFSINFFLYCVTGQNFRRALWQAFPCLRNLRERRHIDATHHALSTNARTNSVTTSYASAAEATTMVAPVLLSDMAKGTILHRSEPAIERWSVENIRIQCDQPAEPSIEMQNTTPAAPESQPVPYYCKEEQQREEAVPAFRRIPFVLFPYRNLIIPHGTRFPDNCNLDHGTYT